LAPLVIFIYDARTHIHEINLHGFMSHVVASELTVALGKSFSSCS